MRRCDKRFLRTLKCVNYERRCHINTEKKLVTEDAQSLKKPRLSHAKAINIFFQENKEIRGIKQFIPSKYLELKRKGTPDHLYLINPAIAKIIFSHLKSVLNSKSDQIICETNAGLGLVATELLEYGIKLVRLYESCPEFREGLKDFGEEYLGRVELFTKDLFNLNRYAYMDKHDQANRVEYLLKKCSEKELEWRWVKVVSKPAMTVIGTMSKLSFIKYLLESLILQNNIINYGRIQVFAIMKPRYYAVLASSPEDNLDAYQGFSVLFKLLFDCELLEKFPRNMFLPWESPLRKTMQRFYPANLEPDKMYLVKINFKKRIPLPAEKLIDLYFFIKQFYGRGSNRIIPTIEKWVPGCGVNIILPKLSHNDYFDDMDIFTQFRELNPKQILAVFKEMINYPAYVGSPFTAMVESELLKLETIETSLSEAKPIETNIAEEIEEKLKTK
ncbi:hypothetical protein NQ318_001135 [Aromia moschata]|uniref:Dimethyladenosine transferase 2, mitochondrial n=1 Tax=Aromia moschata TaxID=1265417 RepID=A0AAV8ZGP6_9CUCU|nr:hypothetical protein NQ318_001135 [Aromia moschata]